MLTRLGKKIIFEGTKMVLLSAGMVVAGKVLDALISKDVHSIDIKLEELL